MVKAPHPQFGSVREFVLYVLSGEAEDMEYDSESDSVLASETFAIAQSCTLWRW